jgi:hypothetical protein
MDDAAPLIIPATRQTQPDAASVGREALAGAGLGLLVGVLLGLSVADLVGKVVAALIGLVGAFLGLSGTAVGTPGADRAVRTGAFGLACTLGVLAGLAIRAEALFTPTITHDVADWIRAGATPAQAVEFVGYARLGIKPTGREVGDLPKPGAAASVLFKGSNAICNEIDGMSLENQVATLKSKPSPLPELAAAAAVSANPAKFIATNLHCGE